MKFELKNVETHFYKGQVLFLGVKTVKCKCGINAKFEELIFTEHSEADAFFCFTNLMAEVRDHFIKSLDSSSTGIGEICYN